MSIAASSVIAAALALSIAMVLVARLRGTGTVVDFQLAGRQIGIFTNACAICGDYVSAASFLGVAAAVYAAGLDGAWYAAGFAAGFVPVLLFVATPLRRFGDRSLPDFLGRRFQSETVRTAAVVVVELIIVAYLIPQAVAGGLAWQLLTDVGLPGLTPYTSGILASTALTGLLVVIGGMRGTTWNQAFQFVALLCILAWLSIVVISTGFSYAGAVQSASAEPLLTVSVEADGTEAVQAVTNQLDGGEARFGQPGARYDIVSHFALVATLVAGTAGLPHVMNRFFTSPSGRAARMTTVWVLGLVGLFYMMAVMMGTAARAIIANESGLSGADANPWLLDLTVDGVLRLPEHALLVLGNLYGGEFGLSLVVTGAMLAIMSTIGGLLLAASASWGHDVYERYINPKATRLQALRAGQAAVVVVAIGAATTAAVIDPARLSASTPSVIASLVTGAFALAGCTLTPCLVLGIWWKRTTATGVLVGLVTGTICSLGAVVSGLLVEGAPAILQTPTIVVGPVVWAIIVVVSLLTEPADGLDEVWLKMHGTAQDRAVERVAQATLATDL